MKKGICIATKNLEAAVKAGFDYVVAAGFEIASMSDAEFDAFCERVRAAGTTVASYNGYCQDTLPIVGDGFDPEKTRAYARLLCTRGERIGVKTVGIGAPAARRLPDGYDQEKAWAQGKRFIEITAEEAARYGMDVMVESLNSYISNFIISLPEAYRMMQNIHMENVKMIVDFAHLYVNGENFEDAVKYLPYSRDIHISHSDENRKRPYLTEADAADLKYIADILKKGGYDGNVTLEPDPVTDNYEVKVQKCYELMGRYF